MPTKKRLTAPTWSIPQHYLDAMGGPTVGGQGGVAGPYTKAAGLAAMQGMAAPSVGVNFQTPNWAALIAGDPDWQAAQSEMNTMNRMDRGSLRDSIRRAVIQAGLRVAPDEDIDAATLAAAEGNQFSSAADISNQLRRGAAQSDADLAARGILSSGQFTENRSVLQRGADTARNDLQSSLLNTIASGRSQYAQVVADRAQQLRGIRESIAARLAQNPGIWGSQSPIADYGAPTATPYAAPAAAPAARQETAAERALRLRSEGMNQRYGLGAYAGKYPNGTLDGAGHVYRNGRWVRL